MQAASKTGAAPLSVPKPQVLHPSLKDIEVKLQSTPVEGRANWVMIKGAHGNNNVYEPPSTPPQIFPEVEFYIRSDSPTPNIEPDLRYGLRIADEEVGQAIKFFNKFSEWIQVAKTNNVKETSKTIGMLEGGIGNRTFVFEVHSDETSTAYSLNIYQFREQSTGVKGRRPLDANDVSSILELLGKWRLVQSAINDEVLHFDRPKKDPLFK